MNNELAQVIALVTYGNMFLHDAERTMADLPANSTFQYISSVQFVRCNNKNDTQGVVIATSVSNWFSFLRSIKATRLWNIAFAWQREDIPEHAAAAFSGAVPMAIQADLPEGYELWYPKWIIGTQNQKLWSVEYRSLMFPKSHALPAKNLDEVKQQLRQAILRAEKFSRRSDINANYWAGWFANALELLDSSNPHPSFYSDMFPEDGFRLESRQILAAVSQAYVFGGMGSWNDLGFEKPETQDEYEQITKELYTVVKFAAVMASNSFVG